MKITRAEWDLLNDRVIAALDILEKIEAALMKAPTHATPHNPLADPDAIVAVTTAVCPAMGDAPHEDFPDVAISKLLPPKQRHVALASAPPERDFREAQPPVSVPIIQGLYDKPVSNAPPSGAMEQTYPEVVEKFDALFTQPKPGSACPVCGKPDAIRRWREGGCISCRFCGKEWKG